MSYSTDLARVVSLDSLLNLALHRWDPLLRSEKKVAVWSTESTESTGLLEIT